MREKHCGDSYAIHSNHSQFTKVAAVAVSRHWSNGVFVLALNTYNIAATTTVFALQAGVTGLHVPHQDGFMRRSLAPPSGNVAGPPAPAAQQACYHT